MQLRRWTDVSDANRTGRNRLPTNTRHWEINYSTGSVLCKQPAVGRIDSQFAGGELAGSRRSVSSAIFLQKNRVGHDKARVAE